MGQVIGTQASMLPPSYQNRAKQLFDRAPSVPYKDVENVFKEDFDGLVPTDVFAEFEMTPIASASIAQVHKAKLKNGDIVAVKIQKPAIKKQLTSDLWAFRALLKLYEYAFELPLSFTSDFIEQHLRMETDFENEAR
jgi:aarF domain-containing kinase